MAGEGHVMRRISTTVYLDDEQLDDLKAISRRTMIPMAAIIRQGINMVLLRYEDEEKEDADESKQKDQRRR